MGYKRETIYLFRRRLEKDTGAQRRAMKYCACARAMDDWTKETFGKTKILKCAEEDERPRDD